jgi:hypothetical protein
MDSGSSAAAVLMPEIASNRESKALVMATSQKTLIACECYRIS